MCRYKWMITVVWIIFIKFSIRNTIEQSVKKSDALEWEDLKPEGCPFEVYSIDNKKYLT